MKRVLIANRGEVVRRVHRTARRLGIETVAVYSDADRGQPYLAEADRSIRLEGRTLAETYLSIDALLSAARRGRADAIHPGYGFLAENADFAERVEREGFIFVGPGHSVMRELGRKDLARRLAQSAGVPVIQGYEGQEQDQATLEEEAERLGAPLLIKAAAGGGGRGVREVHNLRSFRDALASAQREAMGAFGDSRVVLERYLGAVRHVEVQLLGDRYGSILHFYERDCSVQRRKQKVIEEGPAPYLSATLREAILDAAVRLARACGLTNAATAEFLVSDEGEFFFIEANTRLQVEHVVTELITGVDLVELQLRVARGERLPMRQEEIQVSGHAIEARICAEAPSRGFVGTTGRVLALHIPEESSPPVMREVEHALARGVVVSGTFDSLLAKVIVQAPDRRTAARMLEYDLERIGILGIETNAYFLQGLLRSEEFFGGSFRTHTIATWEETRRALVDSEDLLRDAALFFSLALSTASDPFSRFGKARFAPGCDTPRSISLKVTVRHRALHREASFALSLLREEAGLQEMPPRYRIEIAGVAGEGGTSLSVTAERICADGSQLSLIKIGEREVVAFLLRSGDLAVDSAVLFCSIVGATLEVSRSGEGSGMSRENEGLGSGEVRSPLPGTVVRVGVREGQEVERGDELLVLESMKMEHTITAPYAGTVRELSVLANVHVRGGEFLLRIAPRADSLSIKEDPRQRGKQEIRNDGIEEG